MCTLRIARMGARRYGFDPRAHLTETSDLLTPENVARVRASWHVIGAKFSEVVGY